MERRQSGKFRQGALMVLAGLAAAAPADAHPVPRMHHDRAVLVRVTPSSILVDYVLSLDEWTLLRDLQPFASRLDFAAGAKALYPGYEKIYGPLLADGFFVEVNGEEVRVRFSHCEFRQEVDHLRYRFTFAAPLPARGGGLRYTVRVTDSTFSHQPGEFRLALRGEQGVAVVEANVAADPEKAKAIPLQDFEEAQHEQLRTARAVLRIYPVAWLALDAWWGDDAEPDGLMEWLAWGELLPPGELVLLPETAGPSFWGRFVGSFAPLSPVDRPPIPSAAPPPSEALGDALGTFSVYRLLHADMGLALLLVLAFCFGAVHALQPGHGKTMVAAYLVGSRGTVVHAIFLGVITTFTHTSMVFALAIAVPLLVGNDQGLEAHIHFGLSLGCGILVTVFALWLLSRRLSGQADHVHLFGGHHHHGDSGHHHHHHHHHHLPPGEKVGWWALFTMGLAGGLVPCVDALALLAATWILKKLWLGFWLTLAFSLGLASVLVLLGILVVKFRRFAGSRWGNGRFVRSLPILSALATLALGIWMCLDAVKHRPSAPPPAQADASRPVAVIGVGPCPGTARQRHSLSRQGEQVLRSF